MLICVECAARVDEHAPDWRAYVAEPDENDDGEFVLVYCPDCAHREFGPFDPKSGSYRSQPP
jgi:hypothetical protein